MAKMQPFSGMNKEEIKAILDRVESKKKDNHNWTSKALAKISAGCKNSYYCKDVALLSLAYALTSNTDFGVLDILKKDFMREDFLFWYVNGRGPYDPSIEASCWSILALHQLNDETAYSTMETLKEKMYEESFGLFCSSVIRNHPIATLEANAIALLALNALGDKLAFDLADKIQTVFHDPFSCLFKESTLVESRASLNNTLLTIGGLAKLGRDAGCYVKKLKDEFWNPDYGILLPDNPFEQRTELTKWNSLFSIICRVRNDPLEDVVINSMYQHLYVQNLKSFRNTIWEPLEVCTNEDNLLAILAFNGYSF